MSDLILGKWLGIGWTAVQQLPESVVTIAIELFRDEQERIARMNQR